MRSLITACWVLVLLGAAGAQAQSLEESYAKICPQPVKANDEACLALEALISKREQEKSAVRPSGAELGASIADASAPSSVWGPLASLGGTTWTRTDVNNAEDKAVKLHRFTGISGTEMELALMHYGVGKSTLTFRPSGQAGVLDVVMQNRWGKRKVKYRFDEGQVLLSDWFKMPGTSIRARFRIMVDKDGQYRFAEAYCQDCGVKEPPFAEPFSVYKLLPEYKRLSEGEIQILMARGRAFETEMNTFIQDGIQDAQQQQLAEKQQRSAERGALFGAVLQGLAQGTAEALADQQHAQSAQDALLADVQRQAMRSQQAQATGQRSASEPRRAGEGGAEYATGAGNSNAGGALVVEAVADPHRIDSATPDPAVDRQMLVACFLVHNGDFDQGKGAVFFSSTVPATVEKGYTVGDPTGTFNRKVKSSYNVNGAAGCQTSVDAAELKGYMQEVGASYRGHRKIETGMSPLD